MAEKIFFIVNKYSGKGFQSAIEGQVIDACAAAGVEGRLEYTQARGHATELAYDAHTEGYSRVFAMGGDGTVNEAARALVHTSVALGIIPTGSGNGLARHLKVPLSIHEALRQVGHFDTMVIDTLRINGGLSLNVSGVGFDAHVATQFGKDGVRGLVGYSKLVLGDFMKYAEFDVSGVADDIEVKHRAFMMALANASQFGHNALVAPDASVSDGVMDVCFIRRVPMLEAIPFLTKLFRGKITQSRFVTSMRAKRLAVTLSSPQPVHLDGEPQPPTTRVEVELIPDSLKVIVPKTPNT